jgi:hypothetical protein
MSHKLPRTLQAVPNTLEWRGAPGANPGDPNGSWYNPETGESLHPDMEHNPPIGPHWTI